MVKGSRPGFLEGFALFCPIRADSRRSRGDGSQAGVKSRARPELAVVRHGGRRRHSAVTLPGSVRRPSGGFCGRPEPTRCDAGQALEVMREVALVRETSAGGNLCQGEVVILSKQLLRTLDATGNDVLVRRLSRHDLELPREVVGAEVANRRQVLQGQAGVELFVDVLDDRAELRSRERSVAAARRLTGS